MVILFDFISQFYAIYCVFSVIIPHTNVNWQNNIKHNLHNILLFILCTCTHIFRGKKSGLGSLSSALSFLISLLVERPFQ